MVAISQAPSPESNPNSPLPVNGKVVNYTTLYLIGGKFVQQRAERAFATFACLNSRCCQNGVGLCFGEAHPHTTTREQNSPDRFGGVRFFLQVLALHFAKLSRRAGKCTSFVGETINRLMSRTQTSRGKPRVLSHLHGLVLETSI